MHRIIEDVYGRLETMHIMGVLQISQSNHINIKHSILFMNVTKYPTRSPRCGLLQVDRRRTFEAERKFFIPFWRFTPMLIRSQSYLRGFQVTSAVEAAKNTWILRRGLLSHEFLDKYFFRCN